jgi:hypothetical protein
MKMEVMMQFGLVFLFAVVHEAVNGALPERDGGAIHVRTSQELQQAVTKAGSGDTILLEDGAYRLESSLWIESKKHLTLKGASEEKTKVMLMGGGWAGGKPEDVIVIRGSEDIAIAHLTITEARSYGIKIEGVHNLKNPCDIHISHCRFIDIGTRGVKGTATQDRKHIERGSVRHCYFENTRVPERSWLFDGDYISAIDMMIASYLATASESLDIR